MTQDMIHSVDRRAMRRDGWRQRPSHATARATIATHRGANERGARESFASLERAETGEDRARGARGVTRVAFGIAFAVGVLGRWERFERSETTTTTDDRIVAMRAPRSTVRDVRTPVIAKLNLARVGVVVFRCAPDLDDGATREQCRHVLERAANDELMSLARSFATVVETTEEMKREKKLRLVAMSSNTFACLTEKRYIEATKTVLTSMRRDARLAPIRIVDVFATLDHAMETEVLMSMIPTLVLGSFAEMPNWRVFGEGETGQRYMAANFWPQQPGEMTTACGVEIERGVSCSREHARLDRDVTEHDDVELYFPSITAVVLRLQRLESVIDAMREVDVSESDLRDFIRGGKVIHIHHTPVMAQAAPEFGVEVAIIAFRRELPPNSEFQSMEEFLMAFKTRLNCALPPVKSPDDALLADVCFPGHALPYLWPASLLLKNTGATELTARASAVANDQVLSFLWNCSQLDIANSKLAFQVKRSAFMTKEITPKDGCLLPEREFFHSASVMNSLWPAVGMPSTFDTWINPFANHSLSTEVFSPQVPLPPSALMTSSSPPPSVPNPSQGTMNLEIDSILERAKDLSPSRIIAREDHEEEEPMPAPFLGSRITKTGEVQNSVAPVKGPRTPRPKPESKPKPKPKSQPKPETCSAEAKTYSAAAETIAKKLGVDSKDVPRQVIRIYELIVSGKESEITTGGAKSIRDAAVALRKFYPTLQIYEHGRCRKKEDLIALFREKLL